MGGGGRARGSDVWLQRIPQPFVMATFISKKLPPIALTDGRREGGGGDGQEAEKR